MSLDPAAIFDNPMVWPAPPALWQSRPLTHCVHQFCSIAFVPRPVERGTSALPPDAFVDGAIPGPRGHFGYRLYPHPRREEAPVVVYFHGNAEVASDYDGSFKLFHAAGASLMVGPSLPRGCAPLCPGYPCVCGPAQVVDFLGYGWSTGTALITTLPADAEAVAAGLPAALAAGTSPPTPTLSLHCG